MKKINFYFVMVLLFVAVTNGCYVKKAQSALTANRFSAWIGYWQAHPPFKAKKLITFRVQVQQGLDGFEELLKTADSKKELKNAEQAQAFAKAYVKAQQLDPGLHSMIRQNRRYDWLPDALNRAPFFPAYVKSKIALAGKNYERAWDHLRECDNRQFFFQDYKSLLLKTMLADFAERFIENETENNWGKMSENIAEFSKIVETQALCLTDQPCPEVESGKFKSFAAYFTDVRSRTLSNIRSECNALVARKDFVAAQNLVDKGIAIAGISDKSALVALRKQIREEGGAFHQLQYQKCMENKDYDGARRQNNVLVQLGCGDSKKQIDSAEKRDKADNLLGQGRVKLADGFYDEAIKLAKEAAKHIPGDAEINNFLSEARDKKGWSLIRTAGEESAAGHCKKAYNLTVQAESMIADKNSVAGLKAQYKSCATQRVIVLLQSDDEHFNASVEKYRLLSAVQGALMSGADDFVQMLNSDNAPVLGNGDNPAYIADQLGANFAIVLSFRGFQARQTPDQYGKIENYCVAAKKTTFDSYGNIVYVYDYRLMPVKVFTDRLSVSINVQGQLVKVEGNAQLDQSSKVVQDNWRQELWQAAPDINLRTIRYCPRCGPMVGNLTATSFVNIDNFERKRYFPSGMEILKDDLVQSAADYGRDFAKVLRRLD